MRLVPLAAASLLALVGCGADGENGPFDLLTLDGKFEVGLEEPAHVARDEYGVAHIRARNVRDLAFVQGYVMAHDRLPQMDILRRHGAGTLSELFGALDASVIDTDLEMRMHRMKPLAEQVWDQLRAEAAAEQASGSDDRTNRDVVDLLQRFSDGVNAYADDLRRGKWQLDPEILASFPPDRFAAWSPIDSLVLGRFQAFSLSWSAPSEILATEIYQNLRARFPSGPRAGIASDFLTWKPVGLAPTVDGFPNVSPNSSNGSTSDGQAPRARTPAAPPAPQVASVRPHVPQHVFDRARTFFRRGIATGPLGALGPHAFMRPYAGSNNWAVGKELAGGAALLGSDQHLQLPNPSIFYPTHLAISNEDDREDPGELDVLGITFPGIPGVILGSNGKLAWAATVSEHDVNDVYLESIAPCGGGDCVAFGGQQVPIQTVTEEIRIGVFGDVIDRFTATYEIVPHHGPIIPAVGPDHRLVPRPPGSDALSVRYTGHQPTLEIRALWKLVHATSVQQGFEALGDFRFGSQNWTMIDQAQDIGWTTHAVVPVRSPASYRWHAVDRPDAAAPFFVLDGTGAFEWEGELSNQYIPHARMPLGNGQAYLATANADPVGATFDNDPLNQPMVDGRPLYVGVSYAAGVREERITEPLTRGGTLTLDDMAAIQHDTFSTVGAKMVPHVRAALDAVAGAPPAMPADVAPYLAGLPLADRQLLAAARDLLAGWTFATPVALDAPDRDSAATALFNTWMHFFLRDTLSDELATIDRSPWDLGSNQLLRIAYEMVKPDGVVSRSATTGQAMLCDRAAVTGPDDSCTKAVLEAMLAAMQHLGGPDGFATSDTAQWRWGAKHRLTLHPLFPNPSLDLPRPGELALPGFPKPGDNFNVNRSDHGWADLDFSQFADGPAQRFLAESRPGEPIKVRWQIPGGVIYDSRSPHYRDLLDKYYLPQQHFDAPFAVSEIVAHGEHRWELR